MDDFWKGKDYGKLENIVRGTRLMVLGEAHHSACHSIGQWVPGMTQDVVSDHCRSKKGGFRLFRRVERLVLRGFGIPSFDNGRAVSLWDAVMFANYIPVIAANRPRQRPPASLWSAEAAARYRRMIDDNSVDAVLVCGKETFLNTPFDERLPGMYRMRGLDCSARLIKRQDGGTALAAYIHHPTGSFGWGYAKSLPPVVWLREMLS